jgi:hypothetical protein
MFPGEGRGPAFRRRSWTPAFAGEQEIAAPVKLA